ncbi:MAG TPA: acetyl-coenzyme A synthetase, partial [Chloroflexota bacterium]|nr:acetyl-coenzyme A synthetase [Chloroflexota bacterium]
GVTTTKPGSATRALPGISVAIVDEHGQPIEGEGGGYLVVTKPWPSMLRGIYKDPDRYLQTYWGRFPGLYLAGDGVKRDRDGYYWFLGRIDDVMNVSGHRISTIEVESALVDDQRVAEAAVVGQQDALTGEAIFAYVTVKAGVDASKALGEELRAHVAKVIGPIARPKQILFTPDLPKTRSGKIMRRLLRDIANQRQLGDTTTLADAGVVDTIRAASGKSSED